MCLGTFLHLPNSKCATSLALCPHTFLWAASRSPLLLRTFMIPSGPQDNARSPAHPQGCFTSSPIHANEFISSFLVLFLGPFWVLPFCLTLCAMRGEKADISDTPCVVLTLPGDCAWGESLLLHVQYQGLTDVTTAQTSSKSGKCLYNLGSVSESVCFKWQPFYTHYKSQ